MEKVVKGVLGSKAERESLATGSKQINFQNTDLFLLYIKPSWRPNIPYC